MDSLIKNILCSFDDIGAIFLCHDKGTCVLKCLNYKEIQHKEVLNVGDSICIKILDSKQFDLHINLSQTSISVEKESRGSYSKGVRLHIGQKQILIPFTTDAQGASSIIVTAHNGIVTVNAGTITNDETLLDYYDSVVSVGDAIRIDVVYLDSNEISPPMRIRHNIP